MAGFDPSTEAGLTRNLRATTSTFARIAAEHSGMVVAVDADQDAVDLLYREVDAPALAADSDAYSHSASDAASHSVPRQRTKRLR